jgi:hypothetical protein
MARVIRHGNYGVYINDERGRHGRAHAHIVHRGSRIASIYLETLDFAHGPLEDVPKSLLKRIREEQERLLEAWEELNDG